MAVGRDWHNGYTCTAGAHTGLIVSVERWWSVRLHIVRYYLRDCGMLFSGMRILPISAWMGMGMIVLGGLH